MRNIPIALLEHKRQAATTLCWLIKIEPKVGQVVGLTTLDRDVIYNDGFGELTYLAPIGFQPATIAASAEAGVDTSEFQSLVMPEYDTPITEEAMNAGVYDYATFTIYEVNYENLDQGSWIVMSGTLGQMRTVDGITVFGELRSLMDSYRRMLTQLDSRTCRARFGSQPGEERYPCGFDTSTLWVSSSITSVGLENTRTFTASSLSGTEENFYVPGLIRFTSGKNAGRVVEIESQSDTGEISLRFTTPYILEPGVTFQIREDCNKFPDDENSGCRKWFGADWVNHFRGEPYIPIGDEGALLTPGASVGPGSGGSTSDIPTED